MARGVPFVTSHQAGFLWVSNENPPHWEEAIVYATLPSTRFVDRVEWNALMAEYLNPTVAAEHLTAHWGGSIGVQVIDMNPIEADTLMMDALEIERTSV